MWRHGLLLRCKPSYILFKDPAVSLISKTSCLNPKIHVKHIFTNNLSLVTIRSYSKAVSEVLPEISLDLKPKDLEVQRPDSLDNDQINVTKSNTTFVLVERDGTVSEDTAIDKVSVIEKNVIDSEELCLNGIKPILKETDSEIVLRHMGSPDCETESLDKANQNDVQALLKDITFKNNENDLKERSLNDESAAGPRPSKDLTDLGLGLGPLIENNKSDINDQASPKDSWFCTKDDETPVRTYEFDQHQMIFEAIDKTNDLTSKQWDELHKRVLSADDDVVNEVNIQGTIMEKCLTHKLLGTGLSYLNHLSASAQEPNIATIGTFCKLASMFPSEVGRNDNNIQNIITSFYDILRAKYPIFDAVTADNIICGLSVTKRWKEGLKILEELRLTSVPQKKCYSALVRASFDNDEPDVGWELLSQMLQNGRHPSGMVYDSWLQYCKRSAAGDKAVEQILVEKLLHFLANNNIRLKETDAIKIRLWFEYDAPPEADWNVEFTTVDQRGMCQTCHQHLKSSYVTSQEFELLKSAFISKTIVGSNIFLKSTPEELEHFQAFLKETAPYDVVIDGLNVGYSKGSGKGNQSNHAETLQSVVEYFVTRSQKVLVLGRHHMENWSRRHMDFVYKNAEVFLAENLSQDDPFLLYAAMYSGLKTRFISKDLMRGHAFLLKDPVLQSIFLRWQKQYQLQITHIGHGGFIKFRSPTKYNTSAQCNKNGDWHIPYDKETDSNRHRNFTLPNQWLCLNHYKKEAYNEQLEDDSYTFTNNKYNNRENGAYSSNNRQSQFRKSKPIEDGFGSGDDENVPSQFGKRNYVSRGFVDRKESTFERNRPSSERYGDSDDDEDMPSRNVNRRPGRVFSDDKPSASPQFGKRNYVNRGFDDRKESRFGNSTASAERYGYSDDDEDKPSQYVNRRPRQVFSHDEPSVSPQLEKDRYLGERFGGGRPKFRSASKMADDGDSGDEEIFKSVPKQSLSEVRYKDQLLESKSKRAFKSNQNLEKPVRREDY